MAKIVGFDERKKHRSTCPNCAAIIEYVKAELRKYSHTDYSGCSDSYEELTCPNCGHKYNV